MTGGAAPAPAAGAAQPVPYEIEDGTGRQGSPGKCRGNPTEI